ncbi:endoglucanase 13 [Agrilus planipennis]|uniref:Endoglucanase n=1 Tax=Agrilus planipennis TaxID=224129 RepID=A0A7F5R091_AGRPL|nr:endoglucanase 13 [Agrilus planipennis]
MLKSLPSIFLVLSFKIYSPINTLPFNEKYDYKEALSLSLLFYEAQRSGPLPPDNRIPWRGDSALHDTGQNGEDLSGGYYDASDFVKFGFTMTFSTTLLAWGLLSYKDAYKYAGQYKYGLEAVKWATDYFVKCHPSAYEFYGQVGDFSTDHRFWGRPEDLNMSRPAYKIDKDHPGSDLAGEAAAALAASSLVFRETNKTYADIILKHAEELFDFATTYRGLYNDVIPGAKKFYEVSGYGDEITWAAIWLYKATRKLKYLEQAEQYYTEFRLKERPNEFFYNKKVAGLQLLLALETKRPEYNNAILNFCNFTIYDQKRTPKGLIYIDKFGTLSHAANVAFVCLQASEIEEYGSNFVNFAREQIDYVLGSAGRSFVVGYGKNYPRKPHHSASSCPDRPLPCGWDNYHSKDPNPQILYGAVVSGPDENDYYEDSREEFLYNEVTLDYNAGFQGVVAGLIYFDNKDNSNTIEKKTSPSHDDLKLLNA